MVYAASSPEYRAAYLAYLKNKLPFLFRTQEPSTIEKIFTIYTLSYMELRRTVSNPELFKNITGQIKERDKKMDTV